MRRVGYRNPLAAALLVGWCAACDEGVSNEVVGRDIPDAQGGTGSDAEVEISAGERIHDLKNRMHQLGATWS